MLCSCSGSGKLQRESVKGNERFEMDSLRLNACGTWLHSHVSGRSQMAVRALRCSPKWWVAFRLGVVSNRAAITFLVVGMGNERDAETQVGWTRQARQKLHKLVADGRCQDIQFSPAGDVIAPKSSTATAY